MKVVKGIAQFCYDFVVGDDWKIAAAVVTALVLAAILVAAGVSASAVAVITTAALVTLFATAVVVDVRHSAG